LLFFRIYEGKVPVKKTNETVVLLPILRKLVPEIGAKILIDPSGFAGRITFKNGSHSWFRNSSFGINSSGASGIAKDKIQANFFLETAGYPVVPGSKAFFPDEMENAYCHAEKIGFPVFVKPNNGSQGKCVSLVHDKKEFYEASLAVFTRYPILLVQSPVRGKDYRVVVLDEKVFLVYERIPLSVVGDGICTIEELMHVKQEEFVAIKKNADFEIDDLRITLKLKHQGIERLFVPKKGQQISLLNNANLSTGGETVDVTDTAHQLFKDLAVQITRDIGLRFCGVDFMIDGTIEDASAPYWVIEVNSSPSLSCIFKKGKEQEKRVEDFYFQLLLKLEQQGELQIQAVNSHE
jgi:D-alanine-D-alanine ligase-like ATP-grasp enzyme